MNVSVTVPVGQAIDRVKQLLFRPFNLGKWFVIGFCAWLAQLGEGGGSGNFNFGSHHHASSWHEQWDRAWAFVHANLMWIVPLAVLAVAICVVLGIVIVWVSSRGKFMFLHCVVLDKAEIDVPWRKYTREAWSLFLFRVVLGLIAMVPMLPLLAVIIVVVIKMANRGAMDMPGVVTLIGVGAVLIAVCLVFFIVRKLMMDFVVPIMFLRGCTCREGWREFLGLLTGNVGEFVVYMLFQIVLGIAIGGLVLAVVVATCCLAGCVMMIPYVGTVLLLPVFVFLRSYSLLYFSQYGRQYDAFPPPAPGSQPLAQ